MKKVLLVLAVLALLVSLPVTVAAKKGGGTKHRGAPARVVDKDKAAMGKTQADKAEKKAANDQEVDDEDPENTLPKETICHKFGAKAQRTLEVSEEDVATHKAHGDKQGACDSEPPGDKVSGESTHKVTICHKPVPPAERTLQVAGKALDAHLAHGDELGDELGACFDGEPPRDKVPGESTQKVTICHKPVPQVERTLQVVGKALAAHLAHGDLAGVCNGAPLDARGSKRSNKKAPI